MLEKNYWDSYSLIGVPDKNLEYSIILATSLANPIFVGLFLIVVKGFTTTKSKLRTKDKTDLMLVIVLDTLLVWLHKFFGDFVVIVNCLFLVIVSININKEIN